MKRLLCLMCAGMLVTGSSLLFAQELVVTDGTPVVEEVVATKPVDKKVKAKDMKQQVVTEEVVGTPVVESDGYVDVGSPGVGVDVDGVGVGGFGISI